MDVQELQEFNVYHRLQNLLETKGKLHRLFGPGPLVSWYLSTSWVVLRPAQLSIGQGKSEGTVIT